MKYILMIIAVVLTVLWSTKETYAQAVYNADGSYRGYFQTSPSGVTNFYTPQGQNGGSYQTDNGQTSFYSSNGRYQGVITAPTYTPPNTGIGSPREVPQVRSIGGW